MPEVLSAAVAIVCFINTVGNGFCNDDNPVVHYNRKVNEPGQWASIWTTDYWLETKSATPNRDLLYRPAALSSYRIIRSLCGEGPGPFHVINILLHAGVTVLVVRLCRRVGGTDVAALAAGVVYAVLPIHTEVVASVVGLADMLAAGGALLAVLCHGRSLGRAGAVDAVKWRLAAGLAAFIAMASKESGVAVVALVPLFDALWYGSAAEGIETRMDEVGAASRPGIGWWRWQTIRRLAYLVIPAATYFALRWHALDGQLYQKPAVSKTVNVLVDAPFWQHMLGVVQLWGMYWAKTIWPAVLNVNYSINDVRLATGPSDPHFLLGLLVCIVLAGVSVVAWRRGARGVAFISAAIVISYAPTANALVLIQVFMAERIWYLPSVGGAILLGMAFSLVWHRRLWRVIGVLIVVAMMGRCWIRNAEWHDNGALYEAAARDHPNSIGALLLYGQWLSVNGDHQRGIELLETAVRMDFGFTDGHRALGQAFLLAGRFDEALEHLQVADRQIPGHPPVQQALAIARREVFTRAEAEVAGLLQAAAAKPDDLDRELAVVRKLFELGRDDEVVARFREGESRFSASTPWHIEHARMLAALRRHDEAVEKYRSCIELAPRDAKLVVELAMLLVERREGDDLDEARHLAERATDLAPDAWEVLVCRAELSYLRGDAAAALRLYERAIRSLPPASEQRAYLEERARILGR